MASSAGNRRPPRNWWDSRTNKALVWSLLSAVLGMMMLWLNGMYSILFFGMGVHFALKVARSRRKDTVGVGYAALALNIVGCVFALAYLFIALSFMIGTATS